MKCRHCGYESADQFAFCPCCGNAVAETTEQLCVEREEPSGNPAANRILNILKDNLFFVICILVTASAACNIFAGQLDLLNILASVFLWLLYAQVQKNAIDSTHLRSLSGTVYASYVLTNVLCVIIGVCGILIAALVGIFGDEIISEIPELNIDGALEGVVALSTVLVAMIVGIAFVVIAIVGFLLNYFGTRNIHRFLKSVYQSVACGELKLVKCKTAHNWLMVLGVLSGLGALGSLTDLDVFSFVASGGIAAAQILAAMLINKNLSDFE